jgi:hypothetical protein
MDNSRFYKRVLNFGPKRIILSSDFILAIIATALFLQYNISGALKDVIIDNVAVASLVFTSITLAAFTLIVSFVSNDFIKFLKKANVYDNIMFVFEYATYLSIVTFIFSIGYSVFCKSNELFYFLIFIFAYTILSILSLIGLLSRLGMQRAEFEIQNKDTIKKLAKK